MSPELTEYHFALLCAKRRKAPRAGSVAFFVALHRAADGVPGGQSSTFRYSAPRGDPTPGRAAAIYMAEPMRCRL